ncbi:hypothetical protein GCM10009827_026590 [Dactylosporangium maewongense]|uniref:Uncharacterized protein n=1 Tax=Dactylosporangium maewongense TaxID=634393 RepID=A0ABN2A6N3_9ACTN
MSDTPVVVCDTTFRHEGRVYLGEPRAGDDLVTVPALGRIWAGLGSDPADVRSGDGHRGPGWHRAAREQRAEVCL